MPARVRLKEDDKTGSIGNQEALVALAQVDWQTAEPLVKALANGGQQRSSALALKLFYQQAIGDKDLGAEEKYRSRLKTIASEEKNQTRVGRYSLKDFSFKEVLVVPRSSFESVAMWVDEKRAKIYIVYKDQLLSLPLKPATDQPR